jgi:AcrR family transcriptional regulator
MGRPRNVDGRQTRQAIMDSALELFAERGYFGTSLRDIARAVGVRESAFYNYFTSKGALFEALIVTDLEQKAGRFSGALEPPVADIRAALEELATLVLDSFCTSRQQKLFRILMSDGMRLAKEGRINLIERMSVGQARLQEQMRRLVRERLLRPADPELLTMAFMGPLLLWRHKHAIRPDVPIVTDRRTFARQHVDQFLKGAARSTSRAVTTVPGRPAAARRQRHPADHINAVREQRHGR